MVSAISAYYHICQQVLNALFSFSDLLRNIRTQVLIKLIKPYTRIHIPFISKVSVSWACNVMFFVFVHHNDS